MTASIFPLPAPNGVYSIRFYQTGATTGNFVDHEYQFLVPGAVGESLGGLQLGATPTVLNAQLARLPFTPGTVTVTWNKSIAVASENPTTAPTENGVILTFTVPLAHSPLTNDNIVLVWAESAVSKTATIVGTSGFIGTNAANVSTVSVNRSTGVISITFAAGHAPDADSIRVTYDYVGTTGTVTDSSGTFTGSGVTGTINYSTGVIAIIFTGAAVVPYNGDQVTVTYSGTQAWSKGMRIVSAAGGFVEISFDGTNVHGRIENGDEVEYLDRYEPGIAIRGSGNFTVEAW